MDVIETLTQSVWMSAMLLIYVHEVLGLQEEWWGFINASYFIGATLGGFLMLALSNLIQKRLMTSLLLGSFLTSILTLVFGIQTSAIGALFISTLLGPTTQLRDIAQQTIFQQSVPSHLLPKVLSAQGTLAYAIFGLSVLFISSLAELISITSAYLIASTLIFVSCLFGIMNRKRLH